MSKSQTFTIECTMKERWIPHFISMLNYIQQLGELGGSRKVSFYSDGDGDFRPQFKVLDINYDIMPPVSDEDGDRLYDAG